ncbi:hypothetical protein L3C95_15630 [Chitinophaga filiformis]|uniref:hypothetical protein n=1 Tax=Chitinophaga filiformis TaxID=104663 RepID=UPI001F19210F|nr:hypothetical protein [Chitinophaga filiformis]MCF6404327.1 hypothetical protein [Chitinophaga filiformis]
MDLPVQNIVSEVDLKATDALLPLFEIVANAIVSLKQTKDVDKQEKKIQIQIIRGEFPQNVIVADAKTIHSLKVIDNGNGFTDANLKSYQTAYSRHNKAFGCKGIGRFTVLAAFEEIYIRSTYKEGDVWKYREFKFDPISEVTNINTRESEDSIRKTIVELSACHNQAIKDHTALSVSKIAEEIMRHCLIYYLCGDLPLIEILDLENGELAVVNDLYKQVSKEKERNFALGGESFKCYITKTEKVNNRKNHYLHYCANSRVVGSGRSIGKMNSIFSYALIENGKGYYLDIYVVSEYLNKKVYHSRNGFTIPQQSEHGLYIRDEVGSELSFDNIEKELADLLAKEYDDFVRAMQDRNIKELKNYISSKAPRYRRYIDREDILNSIPPNLSDEKKEEALYRISFNEKKNIDQKIQRFIDKGEITRENIEAIKKELVEKTAYDADNLAEYMIRRKAIIDLFNRFLEADQNGKYKLEEDIHNLIFPMGVTDREITYDSHNLWLLDERFATYTFIASDKPITSISQNKSRKEPDLLMIDHPPMFDNPISFAPEHSGEISSMVVFEFKRPGEIAHQKSKADYRWEFSELIEEYFDDFLYGDSKKNYRGSQVVVRKETPKFGYVIVDIIPEQLETYNIGKGYRKTPFGTFYKIYPDLNMHIEVLRFSQLIQAVEKRHTPFFDKLFRN